MKKEMIFVVLLVGILLISQLAIVQAQIQEQTETQLQSYSGLDRFIDNTKLFFSFGDNKVGVALEIREKEVDSALVNVHNNLDDKAIENIERAREKLQMVQERVSVNMAEEVNANVDTVLNKIYEEKSLPQNFKEYILEEEKTQLAAKLVVEVNGKEGQTLKREVMINGDNGQKQVIFVVEGSEGEAEVVKIEGQINQINNNIAALIVEHTYAEGTSANGGESGVVIEGGEMKVKTDKDRRELNEVVNGGEVELKIAHYDPSITRAPTDVYIDPDGDNPSGPEDGTGTPGINEIPDPGVEGVNEEPSPAVDSNEGD